MSCAVCFIAISDFSAFYQTDKGRCSATAVVNSCDKYGQYAWRARNPMEIHICRQPFWQFIKRGRSMLPDIHCRRAVAGRLQQRRNVCFPIRSSCNRVSVRWLQGGRLVVGSCRECIASTTEFPSPNGGDISSALSCPRRCPVFGAVLSSALSGEAFCKRHRIHAANGPTAAAQRMVGLLKIRSASAISARRGDKP